MKEDNYNMKTIELLIDENVLQSGGDAIALVEVPAIEQDFMAFGKQEFADGINNVFLISCSAEKKEYKCEACELYDSPLFKKSLAFSRKKAKSDKFIKIISAKLYLVGLDQVIEPYDLTLKNMPSEEQKAWASKTYQMIAENFNINKDKFIFLAGSAYTKYLLPMFKYKSDFLEGKRLGERMQYLDTFSEAQEFIVVTNNRDHAKHHQFTLVDIEKDIEEEILLAELEELFSAELTHTNDESPMDANNEEYTLNANKFAQEIQEKQMLIAPIMRADYKIPRIDDEGNEYEVFFSADTVKKIAYKLMKEQKIHNINIEHDDEQTVDDVYLVESWIVEDPEHDKSTLYGYKPNKGDWYGMYKVDNDRIWKDYIKSGKVNGVSVEGWFFEKFNKTNILFKKHPYLSTNLN